MRGGGNGADKKQQSSSFKNGFCTYTSLCMVLKKNQKKRRALRLAFFKVLLEFYCFFTSHVPLALDGVLVQVPVAVESANAPLNVL